MTRKSGKCLKKLHLSRREKKRLDNGVKMAGTKICEVFGEWQEWQNDTKIRKVFVFFTLGAAGKWQEWQNDTKKAEVFLEFDLLWLTRVTTQWQNSDKTQMLVFETAVSRRGCSDKSDSKIPIFIYIFTPLLSLLSLLSLYASFTLSVTLV